MSFRNIHPAAEGYSHLLQFLDLFNRSASSEEAGEASLASGGLERVHPDTLKPIYEKSLLILENKMAELDFRDDLLQLQKGLYRELEDLYSLDAVDSRHHFLVVVPVADRPLMLRNCVESLIRQCENFGYGSRDLDVEGNCFFRKVSLLLVDDSADEGNQARIREIACQASRRGVRTRYMGINEQADLIRHAGRLAGEASFRLTGGPRNESTPHKGASVIRNLAYLYLNSYIRAHGEEEKFLVYFLDSDEEFGVKVEKNGAGADIRFINYFYWLDRIFSTTGIEVLTGKVVGDPPVSASVMINTFLDDVLLFLDIASKEGPGDACPFHRGRSPGKFSAEYHDMVELFGYERPGALSYACPLRGDHTVSDCFRSFAEEMLDFFHGLHPTRVQFYRHAGGFTKTETARTVYTGNYVLTPDALKYFIPFAGLKLRMAGPTLGRLLKTEIGDRFASVNMPLLHRRTNPDSSRVYRSGISGTKESTDLSGEFIRQFWGDVMLFSVEALAGAGFPGRRPDLSEISSVVRSVQDEMWRLYREQKQAAAAKAVTIRQRLQQPDRWWNQNDGVGDAVRSVELLCSIVDDNFGRDSHAMKSLSSQIGEGVYTDLLIKAIGFFHEDRSAWEKLVEADIPVFRPEK